MRKALIYIALLLASFYSNAQQPVYRQITEDDGLPDNEIYYILQDSKGIIWISTNSGLCRYNGHSFQYFNHPQLKAKSTGGIQEDRFGRIWGNNFAGQLFYVSNDSLVLVQLPGITNLGNNAPFVIGPQNQLVITSEKGSLIAFAPRHQSKTERPQYVLDTILHPLAHNPFFDEQGRLWAAIGNSIDKDSSIAFCLDGSKKQGVGLAARPRTTPRGNSFILEWHKKIWMFERQRGSLYQQQGSVFTTIPLPKIPGLLLANPLQNGGLALCTNSGLYLADDQLTVRSLSAPLFTGQTISAFCQDKKGNLWVGTLAAGIYFIPAKGLTRALANNTNADFNDVSEVCTGPNNQLLLGFLNGEMGILNNQFRYQTIQPPNPLSNKVQGLFYSPTLQLTSWYSNNSYQSKFLPRQKKWRTQTSVGDIAKDMAFIPAWKAAIVATSMDIVINSLDRELIAKKIPSGWVNRYDTFTFFDKPSMPMPLQTVILAKERGRAVMFDEATETFWGADKNGITLYRQHGQTQLLLNGAPIIATHFCQHNGSIWAGTFSQGLIQIQQEKAIRQYTTKDGLTSNTIYQILGSQNHLWINTDKGLQYFDTATQHFGLIDKTWGLPTYKINDMALANNQLYISTPKGLLYLPDQALAHAEMSAAQQVYLQGIYCNGVRTDSLRNRFVTRQNSFLFKVETPAYSDRALLRYRYRLKGANGSFDTTTIDKNEFEYKSLQPGQYTFELYLIDTKGQTLGRPIQYEFTIAPPFYKTWWFIGLCALLVAAAIFGLVRRRIGQIKKRETTKLHLSQLETELKQSQLSGIKAQMNPHFMFNALNSIQDFILLNDKKQANMYMGKFADLMRMTLDMSNSSDVLLEDEVKLLQLYLELEALRFEEQFSYTLLVDETIDTTAIRLPAMLIQPNIENAVKHGLLHRQGHKQLDVHFGLHNNDTLCCTVTDNGIGRQHSAQINAQRLKKHISFATGATQKRLELLNHGRLRPIAIEYEDLQDALGNAAGTRVRICIPT